MKKYLFGLGAMVVGAGLMFVLMHGEVEANRTSNFGKDVLCKKSNIKYWSAKNGWVEYPYSIGKKVSDVTNILECKVGENVTCFLLREGIVNGTGKEFAKWVQHRISCVNG